MDIKNITKVVVHSGIMHADDVFTVAYIQLVKKALGQEPVQVIREFKIGSVKYFVAVPEAFFCICLSFN